MPNVPLAPIPPSPPGGSGRRFPFRRLVPFATALLAVLLIVACVRIIPSLTPSPTATPTLAPTGTAAPTDAPTAEATAEPTADLSPTSPEDPTPGLTPTSGATAGPTVTPGPTPTRGPTPTPSPTPTKGPTATPKPTPTKAPTATPTTAAPVTVFSGPFPVIFRDDFPDDQNLVSNADGTAVIDVGKASRGLLLAKVSADIPADPDVRIKVVVSFSGTLPSGYPAVTSYQYTILRRGAFDGIPLNMGSGTYTASVYRRIDPDTNNYVLLVRTSVTVTLDPVEGFLSSFNMADFSRASACVQKANALCAGKTAATAKVDAIYRWVIANISYDGQLATDINNKVVTLHVPDPDTTYATKKGICFDYSSLFSAMVRSQGIPCRLVMGIAPNGAYHAWNEVYFEGKGWVVINGFQWVSVDGVVWQLLDTTFGHSISNQQIYNNIVAGNYTDQKYY